MDLVIVKVQGGTDDCEFTTAETAQDTETTINGEELEVYVEMTEEESIKQEQFSSVEENEEELINTNVASQNQIVGPKRLRKKSQKGKSLGQENKAVKIQLRDKRKRKASVKRSGSKKKKTVPSTTDQKEMFHVEDMDDEELEICAETERKAGTGRRKKRRPRKVTKTSVKVEEIKPFDETKVKLDGSYEPDSAESSDDNMCEACGEEFSGNTQLKKHIRQCHQNTNVKCTQCEQILSGDKKDRRKHYKIHTLGIYLCEKCGKSFSQPTGLHAHIKTVHDTYMWKCDVDGCSKEFSNQSNKKKHVDAVHLNLRRHPCPICSLTFKTSGALKSHTYTRHTDHDEKMKYQCKLCKKTFYSKCHLQQHELVHTDMKPFPCPFEGCGKTFRDKSNLTKHAHVHENFKPWVCEDCGEKFSRRVYLKTHQYKHTGVKLFQCKVCNKSFSQQGNLNSHMSSLHSVDRTVYKCLKCDKVFNHKSNYTKHMSNHDDPDFKSMKRKRHSTRRIIIRPENYGDKKSNEYVDSSEGENESDETDVAISNDILKASNNSHRTIVICQPEQTQYKKPVLIIKHRILPRTVKNKNQDESDSGAVEVNRSEVSAKVEAAEVTEEISAADEEEEMQGIDLSNVQYVSDGVSEIVHRIVTTTTAAAHVVPKMETAVAEETQEESKVLQNLIAGDGTAHEVDAALLNDFLESYNKTVANASINTLVTNVNNQAEKIGNIEEETAVKSQAENVHIELIENETEVNNQAVSMDHVETIVEETVVNNQAVSMDHVETIVEETVVNNQAVSMYHVETIVEETVVNNQVDDIEHVQIIVGGDQNQAVGIEHVHVVMDDALVKHETENIDESTMDEIIEQH